MTEPIEIVIGVLATIGGLAGILVFIVIALLWLGGSGSG